MRFVDCNWANDRADDSEMDTPHKNRTKIGHTAGVRFRYSVVFMDFWSAHRVNENTVFSCIFADTCSALLHTSCLVAFSPQGTVENKIFDIIDINPKMVFTKSVPRAPEKPLPQSNKDIKTSPV